MSDSVIIPAFGYIPPPDRRHEMLYGITDHEPWGEAPAVVEAIIPTPPDLRSAYNQGGSNACVGFSSAQHMAIYNTPLGSPTVQYDARWLWCRCCEIDGHPGTDCGQNTGTYLRSAFDILRDEGIPLLGSATPALDQGCSENRWLSDSASVVDEARAAIASGYPISCGSGWFTWFSSPEHLPNGEWMMPEPGGFGSRSGGHAYLVIGASDERQAFLVPNSWGERWCPPIGAWMPYRTFEWLQTNGGGEAAVITDRPNAPDPPPEPPPPPPDCKGLGRRCIRRPCCPGLRCVTSQSGRAICRQGVP